MVGPDVEQRLAGILAADVAGYTRLMADDERATIATITEFRGVFSSHIEGNGGRVVDMAGDSVLAIFNSAAGAVTAAVGAQAELAERNEALAADRRMDFRVGVNLGDIQEADDGRVYGDGVNIAARLEGLADPGKICVSGKVHDEVRSKLALKFTDLGEHAVKNVVEPVRAFRVLGEGEVAPAPPPKRAPVWAGIAAAVVVVSGFATWQLVPVFEEDAQLPQDPILAVPDGPSIAVLPFENLSGDPEQDYFAVGLAGDISAQLSYEPNIRIIGRSATRKFFGQSIDIQAVAQELGAKYLLLGSVQRAAGNVRVTAELLHADDGNQVWAETFDRELTTENLFAVQDEISLRVVSTISDETGVIGRLVRKRAVDQDGVSLSSYECVLLSWAFNEKHTAELHLQARNCLEQVVQNEPGYAEAWAALANIYALELVNGFNTQPDALSRSLEAGLAAVSADDDNQAAWLGLATAYFYNNQRENFVAAAERALTINPNDVSAIAQLGFGFGIWGMYDRGLPLLEKALALSPYDIFWYHQPFWQKAFMDGDYDAALSAARKFELPGFRWTYVYYAATYAFLGQQDKAAEALANLVEAKPDVATTFREDCLFFNFPEPVIAKMMEGLAMAGLEFPDTASLTD